MIDAAVKMNKGALFLTLAPAMLFSGRFFFFFSLHRASEASDSLGEPVSTDPEKDLTVRGSAVEEYFISLFHLPSVTASLSISLSHSVTHSNPDPVHGVKVPSQRG